MGETVCEGSGAGRSVEESSNGQYSLSGEALSKWRSSGQVENGTPSTSPSYWDTDDDEDYGLKPSQLFAKHKWKIEKYSEIKKRELRSSVFDAGGYKWYILIYPQGCDVCNHLSLFLCVANHDKLLPGWSHFAQFTIAVVNKDPKKSKFSDTLHRFWKKEHDWGWKKFIELPKLHDGFLDDSDSLTIEAQVQVIRERVDQPFRCLHCGYRRELVRVYLANVVQNCRHFVEEKRSKLERLIEDKARWTSFGVFWLGMGQSSRRLMSREKMDVILKGVVKHFFIEKEVTATLVMDFLYSGLKALEGQTKNKKSRPRSLDAKELPAPIVSVDKDTFVLADDVLLLLERAALEPLPPNPKEDKGPRNRTKDVNDGEEDNSEAVERDERRLTELGRRTVEIFVLSHIFNKIEVAYHEAISLKRQEALIREEEEEWLAETELRAKRGAAGREKKSKKKQTKQKRNKNKGKDKRKEEDLTFATHEKDLEENQHDEEEKDFVTEKAESQAEKTDTLGDVSDISDSVDGSADILHPDLEDGDTSSVHWDTDALEIHPPPLRGSSTSISAPNGVAERKNQSTMDDSSSTCSNDSVRSGVTNGSYKGNASNIRNQKLPNKGKNQQVKIISDPRSLVRETDDQPRSQNSSPESDWVVVSHNQEPESSWNRSPVGKERNVAQVIVNSVDMDRPKGKSAAVLTSPRTVAKDPSPPTQTKLEKRSVSMPYTVPNKKVMPASVPPSSTQVVPPSDIQSQAVDLRADMQKIPLPKQPATTTITRPSSAPVIPAVQPAPITVSSVQPSTSFPRSVSSAGRLGPDSSLHNQQTYTPQSYKHAIVGNSPGSSSSFSHHPSSNGVVPTTFPSASYSQTPTSSYQSSFPFSQDGLLLGGRSLNSINMGMNNLYTPTVTSNSSLNHIEIGRQQSQMTDEFPHLDIINDLLEDENCSSTVFNRSIFNSQPQMLHRQYSYHGGGGGADLGISGHSLSGGRSRSFGEERFHYMSHGALSAAGPYADGLIPTQWQMANMDLSLLGMRNNSNMEDTTSYHNTYFGLDSSNPSFSSGINGYTEFRPSNGH